MRHTAEFACKLAVWVALAASTSGCIMSHSTQTARLRPAGSLAMQIDSRLQFYPGAKDAKGTQAAVAGNSALALITMGMVNAGFGDMYVAYGWTERTTVTTLIGFGTASLGLDFKHGLRTGPTALSVSAGAWYQPLFDHAVGARVGALSAIRLSENIDFLANCHVSVGANNVMHMVGGAVGFDLRKLLDLGLRPMVEASYLPRANSGAGGWVVTTVIAMTYE
ncbi:MAG: hypothetical protein KC502_23560 [Myxococcales bacterium]|nr:hypothetical protein [Myxococcales bacterium]